MKGFKLLIGKFELWILETSYGPKLSENSVGVGAHDDTDHEIHLTIYDEGVRTPRSDINAGFHNSLSSTISTRCELFLWIWFPASFPITHNCCRSHNTHYWRRFLSFLFRSSLYTPSLCIYIAPLASLFRFAYLLLPQSACNRPTPNVCITTAVNTNLWWNGCSALIFNYVSLY